MGRSYNGRHQSVASEKEDEQREKMGIIESVASERESGAVATNPVLNLVQTKLCIQKISSTTEYESIKRESSMLRQRAS